MDHKGLSAHPDEAPNFFVLLNQFEADLEGKKAGLGRSRERYTEIELQHFPKAYKDDDYLTLDKDFFVKAATKYTTNQKHQRTLALSAILISSRSVTSLTGINFAVL